VIADGLDLVAVADDDDGRSRPRAVHDRRQHPRLGGGVQMRRRFVEQQHRRGGAERSGQAEPLALSE
jgi:hypothetical protein